MLTRNRMMVLLLLLSTSFKYGCTVAQRKELLSEALDGAKKYITEKVIPEVREKAAAVVEAKLKEAEDKKLLELDETLKTLGTIDPDTGMVESKTWKDFDGDRDGELSATELAKVGLYIVKRTAQKVASGEMSKDEASRTVKTGGITLAALLAILLGKRGVDKIRGKKPEDKALAAGAPIEPSPPTPPS